MYLFEKENAQAERAEGAGEAVSLPSSDSPRALDPMTPRSQPEPKADAQPTEPPRHSVRNILLMKAFFWSCAKKKQIRTKKLK